VKFSLLFEMQLSGPTLASEQRLFHAAVEQAVLAEQLGYHAAWAVEHHGLFEYSHSSAPEVFLSFVAARTSRIRLGHGVTLLPHRYNHPIRVAERVATLDVLSGGRVLWGSGKSSSRVEQVAFENDVNTLHEQWLEAVRMIPKMWSADVFAHKGRFFDIPPTQIIPKPLQSPHPPMYAACTGPESAAAAGALGLGALNFAVGSTDYLADKVSAYRTAIARAEPAGLAVTNQFACTPAALVLDDDRKACAYGFRGARFFVQSLGQYFFSGERPTGPLSVNREFFSESDLDLAMQQRNSPNDVQNACVGDPTMAREFVQRFIDIGVDELAFVMQMGTVPLELVTESIRTFGEKVLPYF